MNIEYPKKEYFDKLFPQGYLGTEELSINLYPSYIQTIPGYSPYVAISFFQKEAASTTAGESRSFLSDILREYKKKPAPVLGIPPIGILDTNLTPFINRTGVTIPFDVKNAPGAIVESRLGELLTLKIEAGAVRYPGAKKNELPPASISIPTYPSSEIIQSPPIKPTIKAQEQIAAYTPDQVNIDTLSGINIKMINSSRGKDAYTTQKLKEIARGLKLPISTKKPELVRTILEGIAKNYGISTEGSDFHLISSIEAKIDSTKQKRL